MIVLANMTNQESLIITLLPSFLKGAQVTLSLFFFTLILSLPIGFLLAFLSRTRWTPLRWVIQLYIWVIRGTPLLLQLFFIFFGLPLLNEHLVLDRFPAALIAFVINYTAYFAEIFRGGIQTIAKGQIEAAKMLGLSSLQTIRKIILPQVFKIVLPSLGNETITLVKDTSLVYVVGLSDLLRTGQIALQREVSIVPLIVVGVIYLFLTGIVTMILKYLEKRTNYYSI